MNTSRESSIDVEGTDSSARFGPIDVGPGDLPIDTPLYAASDLLYAVGHFAEHPLLRNFRHFKRCGEYWLTIGGDAERLPPGAAAVRFGGAVRATTEIPNDQFRTAAWYDPLLPHQPYLPDASLYLKTHGKEATTIAWVYAQYDTNASDDFMDPQDPTRVDPEMISIIDQELRVLKSILDWLGDKAKLSRFAVDLHYSIQSLIDARGVAEVVTELQSARDQALEYIAAVSYNISHVGRETIQRLESLYQPFLRYWLLYEPNVGALIDPNDRLMHTYPVLKLIKDECAIYLPWDYKRRPTTGVAETVGLQTMTGEEYVSRVDRMFPLPEAEKGGLPKGSLLSRLSSAEDTIPQPKIQRLLDLVCVSDCLLGPADKATAVTQYSKDLPWNPKIAVYGYIIADERTEARLRHYALTQLVNVHDPVNALLTQAVKWGLPFKLAYPSSVAKEFHPNGNRWDVTEPNAFDAVVPSLYLPRTLSRRDSWEAVVARIAQVAARPEAVGLIQRGGIVGRIVTQFGPPGVLERVVEGPSTRAHRTRFGTGKGETLYSDEPSPTVIAIVLGTVEGDSVEGNKTWFPPVDLVDKYLTGGLDWTTLCENWFQDRVRVCAAQTSPNAKPLTRSRWAWLLKKRVRQRTAMRAKIHPTDVDIDLLRERFDEECGPSWESFIQLSRLHVSVLRGRGISLNSAA